MTQGHALEEATTVEVVAAYSAPLTIVNGVATTPGWTVVGEFFLPKSCSARLDIVALVSDAALFCRARLFDMTDGAPVSGATAETQAIVSTRVLSGVVALTGNRRFQIQAECTGGADEEDFAVVTTATISD